MKVLLENLLARYCSGNYRVCKGCFPTTANGWI